MKKTVRSTFITGLLVGAACTAPQFVLAGDFSDFTMPVSNPVYNGDARNVTMVRPIFLRQSLSDEIKANLGGLETELDLGGDVVGAALQFSYAFSERFSLVAVKDGYMDCEPDNTLTDHSGWIDIAAGLQYSFIYDPAQNFIMSGRLVYESTSGDSEVYQGNGDGNLAPAVLFIKGWDKLQFSGTLGMVLPIDGDTENSLLYDSWNVTYAVTDMFRPLVELNHFYVMSSGDRNLTDYVASGAQADLAAAVTTFNGCDIINQGGEHNGDNANLVTVAVGSRLRITEWLDLGATFEVPLTSESETLLGNRFLVDAVITF